MTASSIQLYGTESRQVTFSADPLDVLRAMRRDWLKQVVGPSYDTAYLSGGRWYPNYHSVESGLGMVVREASPKEVKIWEGLYQLERHWENQ